MKAIILAGGFAKRMWPLTMHTPKPLLEIAGRPIINYVLESLSRVDSLDTIYVSVNSKFEPHFRDWVGNNTFGKDVKIVAEKSRSEHEKPGAVRALSMMIKESGIDDDLLVIAGDNLFDFDVNSFLSTHGGMPAVALYDMGDKESVKSKYGVVKLGEGNVIEEFHEKPEDPASTLISTGCYFFPRKTICRIHEYIGEGRNPDAPGFFVSWLSERIPVQGFIFDSGSMWFDIGSIESYKAADRAFREKS